MNCNFIDGNKIHVLNENIKTFQLIDSYGIIPILQLLTPNENRTLAIFENTTDFKNSHFETGILQTDDHPILPNNGDVAVKKNKNKTNYIPDHGVVNASKSGTMQIVFGASVKCDNISFNDKLLPGVDYLNILVGVLTKFRHGKYVIIVNIEKLFSQMKIKEEYLDALRFFWRHSDQDEVSYYVMLSYLSVCPYICNWSLKQSVKNQAKIIQPTVNKKISTDDKVS